MTLWLVGVLTAIVLMFIRVIITKTFESWWAWLALHLARLADGIEGTGEEYEAEVIAMIDDQQTSTALSSALTLLPGALRRTRHLRFLSLTWLMAGQSALPGLLIAAALPQRVILPMSMAIWVLSICAMSRLDVAHFEVPVNRNRCPTCRWYLLAHQTFTAATAGITVGMWGFGALPIGGVLVGIVLWCMSVEQHFRSAEVLDLRTSRGGLDDDY